MYENNINKGIDQKFIYADLESPDEKEEEIEYKNTNEITRKKVEKKKKSKKKVKKRKKKKKKQKNRGNRRKINKNN